ncbi:hypothetical protein OFM98_11635 [Acinetobacter baumannii]|uniref:hypothetical protein n=1 Tax=Acinetobacter baumannii TaxID=470 RepID=UPI0023409F9E|nr:hypothetical protein [Acinetobacter baumannii]MDC5593005.1 hypothetical protein [Acinetobacter baumannii]MDC5651322.1 hypothetical protein [Acinetobacter baumannii]MDC5654738.1 hypothetical protein [Acinetobacter baumannii]MDC5658145.1 hypothetical protein [Acinetobacter baumannii]
MITYSFDFTILISIVKAIFWFIAWLGSLYLILQRFHLRLQMRFLKNISDEIIKINDSCIEFSFKHKQFLNTLESNETKTETVSISQDKKVDEKLLAEIEILRGKVKNHSDYLAAQLNAFPYGNPINFFYYSLKGKYLWEKTQIEADKLLTIYQDSFLQDTILQSNIDLSEILTEIDVNFIDKDQIDLIVVSGIDLINFLEDHSKKLY